MTVATERARILVIDDDEAVCRALKKCLADDYFLYTAGSAHEAMPVIRNRLARLLLVDIGLPDINGIDLVSQALDVDPDVAIVMLSGSNDATLAALCMQRGALDYVTKPFDVIDLKRAIEKALQHQELWLDSSALDNQETEALVQEFADLRRERDKLRRFSLATLEALVNALEAKDPLARGHSVRVADLAASIANQLELDEEQVELIRTAGRLHDVGYVGVRDDVLDQKNPLSRDQYEHVKDHVMIGVQILQPLVPLRPVAELIKYHHEHWDGNGYPSGAAGEAIPVGGRILAATEIYDALTRDRPDRERFSREEALACVKQMAGTVIDPTVADALVTVVREQRTLHFLDPDDGTNG
jgi:putative nucleotidyltransferase with HDIG domain